MKPENDRRRLRVRVHEILDLGASGDRASRFFDNLFIVLVLSNAAAFTVGTIPSVDAQYGKLLNAFEVFSVSVFTIEYVLRLWSCVESPGMSGVPAARARFQYALRPLLIIDFLVIAPFYLVFLFPIDLRVLRILWLLRLLKLARYSPAMQTLALVIHTERRALVGALLVMFCLLLFASTGIYYLERHIQPEVFGSVPSAMWWAIATLTTVGYGDAVPLTPLGRVFGGLVMLFGLGMFALPIGIIATGFSQQSNRRDFVVSWSLVANVPLFSHLSATEIASLLPALNSVSYRRGETVFQTGDPASSMYFIASGDVLVEADGSKVKLTEGDYFGEMALVEHRRHLHTVTTLSRCRLLELEVSDFHRLTHDRPELMVEIRKKISERKHVPGDGGTGG